MTAKRNRRTAHGNGQAPQHSPASVARRDDATRPGQNATGAAAAASSRPVSAAAAANLLPLLAKLDGAARRFARGQGECSAMASHCVNLASQWRASAELYERSRKLDAATAAGRTGPDPPPAPRSATSAVKCLLPATLSRLVLVQARSVEQSLGRLRASLGGEVRNSLEDLRKALTAVLRAAGCSPAQQQHRRQQPRPASDPEDLLASFGPAGMPIVRLAEIIEWGEIIVNAREADYARGEGLLLSAAQDLYAPDAATAEAWGSAWADAYDSRLEAEESLSERIKLWKLWVAAAEAG